MRFDELKVLLHLEMPDLQHFLPSILLLHGPFAFNLQNDLGPRSPSHLFELVLKSFVFFLDTLHVHLFLLVEFFLIFLSHQGLLLGPAPVLLPLLLERLVYFNHLLLLC